MSTDWSKQFKLTQCLIEEGLIPDECKDMTVCFPADGIVEIVYRVNMTDERLARFQRAYAKYLAATSKENPSCPNSSTAS